MPSAISVKNLTRRFGEFVAVDDVSFDVAEGEIFGFLGANGAGKSTTIRMLCGLLRPTSGTAVVGGVDVSRDPEAVKLRIGYMSQKFSLYEALTVDQNIRFFGGVYGLEGKRYEERRRFALEMAGLVGRETAMTRDLAGGWRQRLALGCAILHEPPIVFLDEPTGGVDPVSRRQFWRLIDRLSQEGTTVLVTTHYLDEAEHCHRIAVMSAGRLAALGTTAELKQVFDGRAIVEVQAHDAVAAMRELEQMPEVEKTSLFGTAVHAVLRDVRMTPERVADELRAKGVADARAEAGRAVARGRLPRRRGTERAMRKIFAVGLKEFRQIRRDRRTLMILLFIPVFFLLLYGYALNFDIRHVRIAVEDRDYSPESRHLVSAFVNSTYFDLVASVTSEAEVSDLMDRDRIRAALIIPRDLGGDVRSGRPVAIEVLINGENANTAATVLGYAQAIIASESATLRDEGARPDAIGRRSCSSSRGSGTTPSSRAACSWCLGSSPTSR